MLTHGLRGLGGGLGAAVMSPSQIFQTAVNAGFDPATATQMTAIALRESSGNPNAANLSGSEQSYGLWQINVQGNPTLMSQMGLTDPNQLLNPATNAQAAYLLYNNNPNNLNVAWYINQPGYSQAYQAQLPTAEAAAEQVLGYNPLSDTGTSSTASLLGTGSTGLSVGDAFSSIVSGEADLSDPTTLALLAAGAGILVYLAS